ncbi:MAG: non-homologous end-joining DNA ligase, partial [Acidobacteriota bacterium]|nr:non-homologous end-joining DNA ligase [Acidobacteriota bacterium]
MFDARDLRPMLAVGGDPEPPLEGEGLLFEPKYDGIRAIVEVVGGERPTCRLWSRNGNEKTAQFPDIVAALEGWAAVLDGIVVFDGEVVALDREGRPQGFQKLQHRINVSVPGFRSSKAILPPDQQPAGLVVFDLLRLNEHDLRDLPLADRRHTLEALVAAHPLPEPALRLSEQATGHGRALYERAAREGWEGLLVKLARAPYRTGRRSHEWRKLKIQNVDDFVVCGYTSPQGTRTRFGALILGQALAPDDPSLGLTYVGDVGTGFSQQELERLWALLQPLETDLVPFTNVPASLARRAHWVAPRLLAQVRYTELTDEGRLRHPAYLGLRDDKMAAAPDTGGIEPPGPQRRGQARTAIGRQSPTTGAAASSVAPGGTDDVIDQLSRLERERKNGRLILPKGDTLDVTNLHKVFWPSPA